MARVPKETRSHVRSTRGGYNDLLIVAGGVYLVAFLLLPREARPGTAAAM